MDSTRSSGGYWLDNQEPEFDCVRYNLTAAVESLGCLEKLNVWKIENSDVNYRYERRSSGMLRVSCWINAELLRGNNSLEQICNRGFHIDSAISRGLEFATGVIQLLNDDSKYSDKCFLYCDVAVGRSFIYDGALDSAVIPSGYDSLYIPDQPLDRNKDGKFSLQEYQSAASFDNRDSSRYFHKYFISDANLINPRFIVRFKLNPSKSSILDNQKIDYNVIDPVTLLPPTGGDTKDYLSSPSIKTSGFEKRYLPIEKVYSLATEEAASIASDVTFASKISWINRQLVNIEEKVREINLNYAEVHDNIDEAANQAKIALQKMTRDKLELCLSMEIELRRQLEQFSWINGVIDRELQRYQSSIIESSMGDETMRRSYMLQFLKEWKQHSLIRNSLSRSKPNELQSLSSIHGDIRVKTDFSVFIDPFYATTSNVVNNQQPSSNNNTLPAENEAKQFLAKFSERANEYGYFAKSPLSSQSYIPPAIQNVLEQEMETIQNLVSKETNSQALKLPSFLRNTIKNESYASPPMHALVDLLRKNIQEEASKNLVFEEKVWSEGQKDPLQYEFITNLPSALGRPVDKDNKGAEAPLIDTTEPPKYSIKSPKSPGNVSVISDADGKRKAFQASRQFTSSQSLHESKGIDPFQLNPHFPAPSVESLSGINIPLSELSHLTPDYQKFSLSGLSQKKIQQLKVRLAAGIDQLGSHVLEQSKIIDPKEIDSVYFSIPFFSKPPNLQMIYSTDIHKRGLDELYLKTYRFKNPCLILIRSGEFRFGAYLNVSPIVENSWVGSPACYLFSLSLDLKIPFHARQVLGESTLTEPMALLVQPESIYIGNGDLTIDSNINNGTSEVENCYGIGLEAKSKESLCLLAGSPIFSIDDLEVWTITF